MKRILPEAFILIDDFIAAAKRTFRIKFQLCQIRRNVFVFFHDVYSLPPTLEGLWLKCRVEYDQSKSSYQGLANGTKNQKSLKFHKNFS